MSKNKERELTEKEKLRTEKINALSASLEAEGYRKTELTTTMGKAQFTAIGLWVLCSIVFTALYMLRNTLEGGLGMKKTLIIFAIACALTVVHELLHGLTWSFFVKDKKSIEFGFVVQRLTPYCACSEPLNKTQYAWGGFMPCLVLGIVPCVIAIFIGSYELLQLGIFMILGAGGDLTVLLKLLSYKSKANEMLILDHPSECGCVVFEK